jgi:hypothetical protein
MRGDLGERDAIGPLVQACERSVGSAPQARIRTRTLLEAVPDEGGHQVSSGVLRCPQQSSGVISRTHQRTIDSTSSSSGVIRRHQASSGVIRRHQASSGVIRHHQASSVISVRSTPRHPAVVGAPDREHLAAVGRRVAKEENARPCPPLGGRHTEHRTLTPLRLRLNELAVVPVGRRGVAPW